MVENDIHFPNGGYSPHLENSISGNIKILVTDYSCRKIFYVCYNIPVDPPIFGTCGMSKVTMLLEIKYLTLVHPGLSKVTMLFKSNFWNICCSCSSISMKYFILVHLHLWFIKVAMLLKSNSDEIFHTCPVSYLRGGCLLTKLSFGSPGTY